MSLNYKEVLMWFVCLSFEVYMTGCEVIWVHRNVTDSFRVGKDGCTNDTNICPSHAECEPDGSCLCDAHNPNFRNPVIEWNGDKLQEGDSYGCLDNIVSFRVHEADKSQCKFTPFQVIPYNHEGPVTKFSHHDQVFNCSLKKALVKFPHNATEVELQWLNESYVDLSIKNNTMHFKWRRSVPDLQGTIIIFNLYCAGRSSTGQGLFYSQSKCLQAKILGTWKTGSHSATSPPSVGGNGVMMTLSTTLTGSSRPGEISGSDDDSGGTIIIIAVVVPVVLLIVLVGVIWWLCKRRKEDNLRMNDLENSGKTNGNQQAMAQDNPTYKTSNIQNNEPKSQEDPGYATPDFKRKEVERINSYPEPGYESADLKRKEVNAAPSDSTYSMPDKNTEEGNSDVKRVEIKGELYALPDKKGNGLNYMDPSKLVSGDSDKNESQKETSEPTEYAQIVGVLKPAPKNKKKN